MVGPVRHIESLEWDSRQKGSTLVCLGNLFTGKYLFELIIDLF
jgi:uncharacterized Ntn-hydrolase superfamily protein